MFCGYGLAEPYATKLAACGVVLAASADDAGTEAVELREHPFFIATAFQPQVTRSADRRLHPLIGAFLDAAASRAGSLGHGPR
jgi:CTP synthase (UTP-ammonia lyase)